MKSAAVGFVVLLFTWLAASGVGLLFISSSPPEFDQQQKKLIARLEASIYAGLDRKDLEQILEKEGVDYRFYRNESKAVLLSGEIWTIPEEVTGFLYFSIGEESTNKRYKVYTSRVYIDSTNSVYRVHSDYAFYGYP